MNKKFIRILSFMLSVMMLFGCVVTASAEDGDAVTPEATRIKVEIRVEGLKKTLAEETVEVDEKSTLKAALAASGLDVVFAEDGYTITSVKGEAEVKTSKWQYAVDGVIKTDKVNALVVENKAEIILYNATEYAVIPSADATDAATGGVIVFNGTDKDGKTAPISGATVKWQKLLTYSEYTTDSKGRIVISDTSELAAGDHAVEIMKTNAYDVPEIVRMKDMKVKVTEPEDVEDGGTKTFFEEVYDFLYSILKGVIDVWMFYINAIIGIFNGEPIFGAVETTPVV